MDVELYNTEKGKDLLIVDGYTYYEKRKLKTNEIVWQCSKVKKCTAKVYTLRDKTSISRLDAVHCHEKDEKTAEKKILNEAMKWKAEDISERPSEIINSVIAENPTFNLTIKDVANFRKNIYRKRRKLMPGPLKNREEVIEKLIENGSQMQQAMAVKAGRSTVPQVFIGGQHVGGCDDTIAAYSNGTLEDMLDTDDEKYDYDLIVIGGGSGGLSASKEAAKLGKKVAVLDFVTPSPVGTTWGLGGTCVNVGCIPKKLMHQAALLGQAIKDSKSFGWNISVAVEHNWEVMRQNVQNHISSLNWNYKVQLRTEQVKYLNAYAEFLDAHRIKATDKKGKETVMSSKRFIIATGERPRYPDIEGAKEYGITSDDLFSLKSCPGKTLVVGASYVALECAGFLAALGLEVTVMVRSILLRGFDQDMAEKIGSYMATEGIKFLRPCIPSKVEKVEGSEHNLRVTGKMESGEVIVDDYDTVLFAIGRNACTDKIGLDKVDVNVNPKNGKIPVENERTNIPHIYAIGDILEGKPELTPVAIEAGLLLARRLYAKSNIQCDYTFVPTTVFTPLEYGCIGFSEELAIKTYGEDNIEVYHTSFTPLEWTLPERGDNSCYVKLICLISENERVIGFHYLGPNAGEVTQGFALGLKMKATKKDFEAMIGIHPTCAEIFTTLTVTKRSGKSIQQTGC